ncbi:Rop family plasmid primer RNA-binding protein, partial [Klebsiella pneumoniae]
LMGLDPGEEAGLCEQHHDDAEHLFRTLASRLHALQDGNLWPECLLVSLHDDRVRIEQQGRD